jgi:MATE family multidrug resistance protein
VSSPVRDELRRVLRLALPLAGAQVGTMLMGVVDTVVLGRFSTDALAAAAVGNAVVFGTILVGQGVLRGIDPLVSQAHGAGDGPAAALALQRGLVLLLPVSLAVALLWLGTEAFLLATGQPPTLARDAHRFVLVQIPSIPFFLAFFVLRSYLQGREIVRPALLVVLAANVVNAVLNWALVFGHLGSPRLGLVGGGLAVALARASMTIGLVALVWRARLHEGAWVRWSRAALDPAALGRILAIGAPIGAQMGFEVWAFGAAALLAGRLGAESIAAHQIALQWAALSFMLPLGIGQAAVTRVGNLIGARALPEAERAAWVAIGLGAAVMAAWAVLFVVGREWLPRLYTSEAVVIAFSASVMPIAAAFQIFDGTQVVAAGVLGGMGRTRPAAVFNLVGHWMLGLPLAWLLGIRGELGLPGIWWGLALGLAVVSGGLLLEVRRRGPARAALVG